VDSDADEQLIIHIPFTGSVKLKSFVIIGGPAGAAPKKVKLYAREIARFVRWCCLTRSTTTKSFTNREDIDFENADDIKPIQEFDLVEDFEGQLDYPTNVAKFTNVSSLTMYIPTNFGADSTRIYYIGMKGEYTVVRIVTHASPARHHKTDSYNLSRELIPQARREPIIANYELKPNPALNKGVAEDAPFRPVQ
jgi:hypothetical protein